MFGRKSIAERPLTREEMFSLKEKIIHPITNSRNIELLGHLSIKQREQLARETKSFVFYFGDEVPALQKAEEDAAMSAAPRGYELKNLIGLNIGCGTRTISPYLLQVDIMREGVLGRVSGEHGELLSSAFLAVPDDLPFKPGTIDYIVALHMLEHVEDPVGVVDHWLDIIKPGGGIGIVVPDWRYIWDSRNDSAPYGHKWNPTPSLIQKLYNEHWSGRSSLERLNSCDYAMSIDFVLRKNGEFVPFRAPAPETMKSGRQRFEEGIFLHGAD